MSRSKINKPLWLNWEGRGYFGVPHQPARAFPVRPLEDATATWMSAFQHARQGNFRYVGEVARLIGHEREELLYDLCADLLGDAGLSAVFADLLAFLALDDLNTDLTYAWCQAIAARGRLGDIPALLDAYEANISDINDDNEIVPIYIASVIEPAEVSPLYNTENFSNVGQYRASVADRCQALAQRFGGDDVLLWRGEPTSVRRMARHLLEAAGPRKLVLPHRTRHRFEASTGIDCTAMFDRRGNFKALAAAAIAEAFLDSPAAEKYVDGVRYFFGHALP